MTTNEEVRQVMYAWHGGQATMLYQAASSGLVSDWQKFICELYTVKGTDYEYLKAYLAQAKLKPVTLNGARFTAFPWATHY